MNCILKAFCLFDIASNIIRIYFYAVSHILGNQQFNNHLKSYKRIYTIKIVESECARMKKKRNLRSGVIVDKYMAL